MPTSITPILVHRAVAVTTEDSGDWIEGEREEAVVESPEFPLVIFLEGTRESARSGRRLEQPMALIDGTNSIGEPFSLRAKDRIKVTSAPGLAAKDVGFWQVDGDPLPFGPPGQTPVGFEVLLRRVVE